MDEKLRNELLEVLSDIRAGMIANRYNAPVFPALQSAERKLLGLVFSQEEVDSYYASGASNMYAPTKNS